MTTQEPQLDGYTVEAFIGSGGSADVWRLTAPGGADMAAKVFREAGEASGRAEWRSMRRHAGAHVMPVVDLVRDDAGRSVLLMPYQTGGSLHDVVIGRGGLTAGECVTALAPVAGALSRIHDGGSIHGDVTPKNVLFDGDGRPVLSDLGAARVAALPGEAEWGSAGYVAPEVLEGHSPAASADVYSLAAVAWFALVGEAPAPASLRPHLRDLVPDVPEALERLVSSCLSLTPSARPYSEDVAHKLLDAARPVAVPLDRAPSNGTSTSSATNDSITRRLREEAQKRQVFDAADSSSASASRGAMRRRGGASTVPSRVGVPVAAAGFVGLTLVGAAIMWPTPHDERSPEAIVTASTPQRAPYAARASTPTSVANRPVTQGDAPSRAEVQRLLECRADAWNRSDPGRLNGCLATRSPARTSDESALAQARTNNIAYSGIAYRITSFTAKASDKGAVDRATATVTRSAYTVARGGSDSRVPAVSNSVELRFVKIAGAWQISEWRPR